MAAELTMQTNDANSQTKHLPSRRKENILYILVQPEYKWIV